MSQVVVIDRLPSFTKSAYLVLSDALREGARDILKDAKNKAPYEKGGLRSDTTITSPTMFSKRVSFWKEYAGYQERGMRRDGSHKVRNYSTPGTGAHFLEDAGNAVVNRMPMIYSKHAKRARP